MVHCFWNKLFPKCGLNPKKSIFKLKLSRIKWTMTKNTNRNQQLKFGKFDTDTKFVGSNLAPSKLFIDYSLINLSYELFKS